MISRLTLRLRNEADRLDAFTEALHYAACAAEDGDADAAAEEMFGDPEIIGNDQCPVMLRWTLMERLGCKVLLHHFLPNGDDPEPHDHPRSFWTIVLGGGYVDEETFLDGSTATEPMTRGRVRFRPATHMHRTLVGPNGCWTIVVMGPLRREWGFYWDEQWWPWKAYLDARGEAAIRCER